jgi:glucose dehydrogenase
MLISKTKSNPNYLDSSAEGNLLSCPPAFQEKIFLKPQVTFLCSFVLLAGQALASDEDPYRGWSVYGGGPDSIRYSSLDQINRENVKRLQVAWTYDTGDAFEGSEMQCNPIVVDGVLFATSPKLRVFALDAATGGERWSFDPFEGKPVTSKTRNRGLTYWANAEGGEGRIFVAARQWLWALESSTGKPVKSFGVAGRIDLREGFERPAETLNVSATTPGIVYEDMLILGSIVSEALPSSPGDIRAFDARTGELRWSFHTIPHPGEPGYKTWPKDAWKYIGGANNWTGMSLDIERGIVYAPTGSAAFDFYGANRAGEIHSPIDLKYTHDGYNKFLDPNGYPAVEPPWGTLNAIDLNTGEYAWTIPFGEFPELVEQGLTDTGSENYGGPIVTAGGLLFIGATNHDRKFRAYDKLTGELLWETQLPASGNATPAMYEVDGRQFVVIGAGGGKSGAPSGGSYVAFSLPVKLSAR